MTLAWADQCSGLSDQLTIYHLSPLLPGSFAITVTISYERKKWGLFVLAYGKAVGLLLVFYQLRLARYIACRSISLLQVGGQSTLVSLHIICWNSATLEKQASNPAALPYPRRKGRPHYFDGITTVTVTTGVPYNRDLDLGFHGSECGANLSPLELKQIRLLYSTKSIKTVKYLLVWIRRSPTVSPKCIWNAKHGLIM